MAKVALTSHPHGRVSPVSLRTALRKAAGLDRERRLLRFISTLVDDSLGVAPHDGTRRVLFGDSCRHFILYICFRLCEATTLAGCSVSREALGAPDHVTLTSHVASALVPVPRRGLPQPLSLLQMTRPQLALLLLQMTRPQLALLLLQLGLLQLGRQTLRLLLMEARSYPPPRSGRRAF